MKTRVELVKDLITGLNLAAEDYLELVEFITAQSGVPVSFLNCEVKGQLDGIKTELKQQGIAIEKLLQIPYEEFLTSKKVDPTKVEEVPREFTEDFKPPFPNFSSVILNDQLQFSAPPMSVSNKEENILAKIIKDDQKEAVNMLMQFLEKEVGSAVLTDISFPLKEDETVKGVAMAHFKLDGEDYAFTFFKDSAEQDKKSDEKPEQDLTDPHKRKGFSKNGLKLGRPCVAKQNQKPSVTVETENRTEEKVNSLPEILKEEITEQLSGLETTLDEGLKLNGEQLSEDDVASLKMGGILPLQLLYQTKANIITCDQLLNCVNPLGVLVPYTREGKVFAVATTDLVGVNIRDAILYAQSLPLVNGKSWMVLTPQQKGCCKINEVDLNRVLKKVGGDPFVGEYFTYPPSAGKKKPEKFRLTVEL